MRVSSPSTNFVRQLWILGPQPRELMSGDTPLPLLFGRTLLDAAEKYDPNESLPGRAVTREVIDNAIVALDKMVRVWKERQLP